MSRRNGAKGCCAEEESVDKVEWEDKVEKVEKQECSVDVEWKGRRLEDGRSRELEEKVEMEVEQNEKMVAPESGMHAYGKLPANVGVCC